MNKTIILGRKSSISKSIRANKWGFGVGGTVYILLGIFKSLTSNETIISLGYIIMGVVIVIYGIIVFSLTPLTPKVKISNDKLEFKNKILSRATLLLWTNITSIEYGSYEITFHLIDRDEKVYYASNPDTSKEIKSIIREVAVKKNIPVTGG